MHEHVEGQGICEALRRYGHAGLRQVGGTLHECHAQQKQRKESHDGSGEELWEVRGACVAPGGCAQDRGEERLCRYEGLRDPERPGHRDQLQPVSEGDEQAEHGEGAG